MVTLSNRQRRILDFIISFTEEQKFPPTIREIGEEVEISSTSVVNYNLAKLEEFKMIFRQKEVSRGLSVNWPLLEELKLAKRPGNGNGNGFFEVPLLGHIAAGVPIQVTPTHRENAEEWVKLAGNMFGKQDELFALQVKGDSMVDASVLEGDIVILRHQETANDGDMVAAWIEEQEETTLKYLYRDGDQVKLVPANSNYKPIVCNANQVRINGKVVSVIRHLH